MTRSPRLVLASANMALAVSLVFVAGCGERINRAAVQGTVTFDGAPIDGGRIMFIAADKKGSGNASADITAGKYSLPADKGPSVGNHRVEFVWYKKTGNQVVGSDPPNMVDEKVQVIPKQFNKDSRETADVKAGPNTFNFDLKSSK